MNKIDMNDDMHVGIFKGLDVALWHIMQEMIAMDPEWAEKTIKNTLDCLLNNKEKGWACQA